MSGATTWTPDKITAIGSRLVTYNQASNALAVLQQPNAAATVSLYVSSSNGSANFDFKLDIVQAIAFFTPVVAGIGDELTAQGVDLSPPGL